METNTARRSSAPHGWGLRVWSVSRSSRPTMHRITHSKQACTVGNADQLSGHCFARRIIFTLSDRSAAFFRARPPRGFFSAPRGAISAARRRRRKFSGGGQACDFRAGCGLMGELTCGGRCLVIDGDGHDAAPRGESSITCGAKRTESGPLRAQARSARTVMAQRALGGARKALLRDRSTDSHTLTCKQARLAYGAASCSRSSALRARSIYRTTMRMESLLNSAPMQSCNYGLYDGIHYGASVARAVWAAQLEIRRSSG